MRSLPLLAALILAALAVLLLAGCGGGGLSQSQVDRLNRASETLAVDFQHEGRAISACPRQERLLAVCVDLSLKSMQRTAVHVAGVYRAVTAEVKDHGCRQAMARLSGDVASIIVAVKGARRLAAAHRWAALRAFWSRDPLPAAATHHQAVVSACHLSS